MSNLAGKFDPTIENALQIVGVHAVVLHNGLVLYWCYDKNAVGVDQNSSAFKDLFNNPNAGSYQLWDFNNPDGAPDARDIGRNSFCAGQCALPDGTILVAGGQDGAGASELSGELDKYFSELFGGSDNGALQDLHSYDPVADVWTRWPDMADGRYYPTCLLLDDGNAFIAGGLSNLARWTASASNWGENDQFETANWTELFAGPTAPQGFISADQYPVIRQLPGTRILFVHIETVTRLFDLNASSFIANATFMQPSKDAKGQDVGRQTYPMQTGHVLLPQKEGDKPRIMFVGGSTWTNFDVNAGYLITPDFVKSAPAVLGAFILDFDPTTPTNSKWRLTKNPPLVPRLLADTVLLPDGTVFVVNGIKGGAAAGHSQDAEISAELFDPVAESFSQADMPDPAHPRGYHSTAVLLPNACVAVAGNTGIYNPGEPVHKDDVSIQVYQPPYLFNGPRPVIAGVPNQAGYGSVSHLDTSGGPDVTAATLMRPCAVTHSVDMDQRAIILLVKPGAGGGSVDVTLPTDKTLAPPGFYMLFCLAADKTPSMAAWLNLMDMDPTFPPLDLGDYSGDCVIDEVFEGDLTLLEINQHCKCTLQTRHGSITIKQKVDQHSYAHLQAAGNISIQGVDQHSNATFICGGNFTMVEKVNEYSQAIITAGGSIDIGQKYDNTSGGVLTAGTTVHFGEGIDQHSVVTIVANGDVTIDQKIDQHSVVDITSLNGNINIGQAISGNATATLRAPNGSINITQSVDGGCTLNWTALALNCPSQNGTVNKI